MSQQIPRFIICPQVTEQDNMSQDQTSANSQTSQSKDIWHTFAGRNWKGTSIIAIITAANILAVLMVSAIAVFSLSPTTQIETDQTEIISRVQKYSQEQLVTVVFLATSYSDQLALEAIKSFLPSETNKQISRVIVGLAPYMIILSDYLVSYNIKVVECEEYPYQVSCLDKLVALVSTELYFFTTTDWRQDGHYFVSYSALILQKHEKVSQVLPYNVRSSPQPIGFSLAPGLHRMSDYRKLQSYSKLTSSSDLINYNFEAIVSKWFISQGYKTTITNKIDMKNIQVEYYLPLYTSEKLRKNNNKPNVEAGKPKSQPLSYFVKQAEAKLKQPSKIFQIQLIKSYSWLPFCILVFATDQASRDKIMQSITSQNYSQAKTIAIEQQSNHSYYANSKIIKSQCQKNAIVMFVDRPLKPASLDYLNSIHQQYMCWITYSNAGSSIEVHTLYTRVYELLHKNDFDGHSKQYLQTNDVGIQTIGPLELFPDSSKSIDHNKMYESQDHSYWHISKTSSTSYARVPYSKINRLNQDMPVDIAYFDQRKQGILMSKPSPESNLSVKHMIRAAERQEMLYLPEGHSIQQLEYLEYDKKYNISQYQAKQKQVPFCLTVLSRNNIQNDRYVKVMESVLQQKYENFHIVFADDLSTDDNLNASIRYLLGRNFPRDRMTFIQSKSRNFATYNIINAAFNYCGEDDVQMLLDGDDELIGKYAFQVMNSIYQQNPKLWVVYSNYKANNYIYGRSLPILKEEDHVRRGKRLAISKIGPIRTWRVKLLYNIPAAHHKMSNNQWLDTVYDDALQHPLIELAGLDRVRYVNQILYEYNVAYGDNDDSTKQKRIHRTAAYIDILKIKPLAKLNTLQNSTKNQEIQNEFLQDKGKKYVEFDLSQWKV